MRCVQHVDFAQLRRDGPSVLVEGNRGLRGLAADIDVQQVTGMDGGLVGVDDGLGTVALSVGEVGYLGDGTAGDAQEGCYYGQEYDDCMSHGVGLWNL